MHRLQARCCAPLLLLLLGGASAFSLSRTLQDVGQDVAEDSSLYSQEMRLGSPELNLASPHRGFLDKYVNIKSSPDSYVSVQRG